MYVNAITPHARQRLEHRAAEIGLDANLMYKTLADCLIKVKIPCAIVLGETETHRLVAITEAHKQSGEIVVLSVLKIKNHRLLSEYTTATAFYRAKDLLK